MPSAPLVIAYYTCTCASHTVWVYLPNLSNSISKLSNVHILKCLIIILQLGWECYEYSSCVLSRLSYKYLLQKLKVFNIVNFEMFYLHGYNVAYHYIANCCGLSYWICNWSRGLTTVIDDSWCWLVCRGPSSWIQIHKLENYYLKCLPFGLLFWVLQSV